MIEKILDVESVTGWVVETPEGTLIGPFDSAEEASEWIIWDDTDEGGDGCTFDGKIRPILVPDIDEELDEYTDDCEDCEDECECGRCSVDDEFTNAPVIG